VTEGFATAATELVKRKRAPLLIFMFFPLCLRCLCGNSFDLDFHDLVFFVFGEVGDLGHVLVGQLLHIVQPASLFVF